MGKADNSQRPYLLRAMHEWMTDRGHTPHLVVNAMVNGVEVPSQHIQDGRIVLNVSYSAVHRLSLENDFVTFEARFSGVPRSIRVPLAAVLGIYARETGQGMVFSQQGTDAARVEPVGGQVGPTDSSKPDSPEKPDRSHLKVVK